MLKVVKQLLDLTIDCDGPMWIVDGGCNIGTFSKQALLEFPDCRILAFEPDPDSSEKAAEHFGKFGQFELVRAGLGREKCRSEFFRGPSPATNSLLPRPDSGLKPYYPDSAFLEGGTYVDVVTLDDECEMRGIMKLALVKLDLQGGELAALAGASKLLASDSIRILIVEAVFIEKYKDQCLLWELWGNLDSKGYSLYSMENVKVGPYQTHETSLRNGQWNQCDAIFISRALRESLDANEPA